MTEQGHAEPDTSAGQAESDSVPAPTGRAAAAARPRSVIERIYSSGQRPLTPEQSAARVRRFGAWYTAEHYLRNMRRYGSVIVVSAIGEPLVYLLAMGLGLASLIEGGQVTDATGATVSYLMFIAPALLAAGALMAAAIEFTYPVMDGFTWHRLYYAPQATPLQPWQIAGGPVIAVSLRFIVQSVMFYLIMLAFGAAPGPWGWAQVITATLGGLAIGLPIMAFAASLKRDGGQFALLQRFLIMPLFLFSATFYPLSALPVALQWIGWISPQWHAAQLGRILSYGMANPSWLTVLHVMYLTALAAIGWWLVHRVYTRRLGWVPGSEDRDARVPRSRPQPEPRSPTPHSRHGLEGAAEVVTTPEAAPDVEAEPAVEAAPASGEGLTSQAEPASGSAAAALARDQTAAALARRVPPMPPVRVRTGPGSGLYGGNVRAVVQRGLRALRTSNWTIFVSGFFEPVLYLLSLGLGLGSLIGTVDGPAGPMTYGAYIAPALLAVSAMNGAIYDSTWGVFFKMRLSKLYQTMLNTSLGPLDVAFGEITLALLRGGLYSVAFLVVMTVLGHVTSWWALAMVPAALLIAFAFASVGMAVTSYMTRFQQMDWIMIVLMPMFLFSATFYPLSVYPEVVQWIIQALPLWHGVELLRQLSVGVFTEWTLVHVGYFVVMIAVGLVFTARRLTTLFLR